MEYTVNNLPEYITEVTNINIEAPEEKFWEKNILLFRGQSNCNYELVPSLGRNRTSSGSITIFNEERNLIESAKFKLPELFNNNMEPVELLALLQHHGIPTRLLDITENALVALYFACCSNENVDGEVIVFKYDETDIANYPIINGIAESYKFAKGSLNFIKTFYKDLINQPYFIEQKEMDNICHKTEKEGAEWIVKCCKKTFFIHAPIRSVRQQVQSGRYILFPNRISYYGEEGKKQPMFESIIDPIKKDSKIIAKRIIIPKDIKKNILEQLRIMGITKASLFCDSVDAVCEGIVESCKRRL